MTSGRPQAGDADSSGRPIQGLRHEHQEAEAMLGNSAPDVGCVGTFVHLVRRAGCLAAVEEGESPRRVAALDTRSRACGRGSRRRRAAELPGLGRRRR